MSRTRQRFLIQMMQRWCAALLVTGIVAACGDDDEQRLPSDFSVTLHRGICFGACPVYTVSVGESGLVRYEGQRCVRILGVRETNISRERLEELQAVFHDVEFFALDDLYRGDDDGRCAPGFFDGTVITTTLRENGGTKTVRHFHGCNPAEITARLDALERKVDELLDTTQWVPCGSEPNDDDYSECYRMPGCG